MGDWDQPGNVVDTLGELPRQKTLLERQLLSKFSFDKKYREFSDLKIYTHQNSSRFHYLLQLLKFPCQPFFTSIFNSFNITSYNLKPQKLLQRRLCLEFCNWNPSNCFLEDSHSGNLRDLMTKDFHNSFEPEFESQFSKLG